MLPIGMWKNVTDLNAGGCPITHKQWRLMAQQNWPCTCSVKGCDNYCDSLSCVYRDWDNKVCIVPMCRECKKMLKGPFQLKWVFLMPTNIAV